MHRSHGFTLFELVLVIALAALLAGLGTPSFVQMTARSRIATETNALHHALHRARRESVKRNQYVALCKTADGARCDPALPWGRGWMVFVDSDRDDPPQRDPGEIIVQYHRPSAHTAIRANRTAFVVRSARRRTTNGTFVICDRADRAPGLALVVSYTGRPRTTSVDRVSKQLACPGKKRA